MPDRDATHNVIINTLSAGEMSPSLFGRTDLAKFRQSAALATNFMVDYRGGMTSRPGTQFIGTPGTAGYARLIPFIFSNTPGQTYVLVLTANKMEFIKNPVTASYPNSSNAGFITSGGVRYSISTPWAEADLKHIKFVQLADTMRLTRAGYPRQLLTRLADNNWTLAAITDPTVLAGPTITVLTISALPAGSTDPQTTRYCYCVSAVDQNDVEGLPGPACLSAEGIDIGATQGSVTLVWGAVATAKYYKIYKQLPAPGNQMPPASAQFGFMGFALGNIFTDSNIVPDFTQAPLVQASPFNNGQITGFSISASTNDWNNITTALTITDATGTGAELLPIIDSAEVNTSGNIVGIAIKNPGKNYTAPTVAATAGAGTTFTATLTIGPTSGQDPDVCGLFQQRIMYASSTNKPNSIFGARPGGTDDFRVTNPTIDSDAYTFGVFSKQVVTIKWLLAMPGGLVVGTNSGISQLTGGSASASNPTAVTPSTAVFVPQSYYGTDDIHPIVIDYDILYVQYEGSIIRDLQYNFFVNIYQGEDISAFSAHLFYPRKVVDWDYQDVPFKTIWAIRDDGEILTLAWLKSQQIMGWSHSITNGFAESVCAVPEGTTDAVYMSVLRNGGRCVERVCEKVYNTIEDAWCLDAALSNAPSYPAATLTITGSAVAAGSAIFASGDVGKVIRVNQSKATITAYTNSTHVTIAIADNPYLPFPATLASGTWRMDPVISGLSGLDHLNGMSVLALVDGVPQGPFTVGGGAITLTAPGSAIVVGLAYVAQLQPVYLDVGGETTIQGARKKSAAVTIRVKDAARPKIGLRFDDLQEWIPGYSSTDPVEYWPAEVTPGLFFGDMRIIPTQDFNVVGNVCIQQDLPLPVQVLAIIPEVAQGDTP